jgi:myo-inositol-1-phosphate synthase
MRAGIWLIGGRGSVATTAVVGALALRAGLAQPAGCVTAHPALAGAPLPGFDELIFGGHDVTTSPLAKRAEQLAAAGGLPSGLVTALRADLAQVEADLRPAPVGATQAQVAAAIADDITSFAGRHRLDRVVVVNVSSTEPLPEPHPAHASLAALTAALATADQVLPRSRPGVLSWTSPRRPEPGCPRWRSSHVSAACPTPVTTARPAKHC